MQKLIIFALLLGLSACTNKSDNNSSIPEAQELIFQGDGNFGVVNYGSNPIKSIVFTNNTSTPVVGNPVINGSGFDLALQLGCETIASGKSCLVKVIFQSATKESGNYNASLNVGGQIINLSASIPTVPEVSYEFSVNGVVVGSGLDLGELSGNNIKMLSVKVKNNSPKSGTASNLVLSNSKFRLISNQCSTKKLKPNESCTAKVVVQGDNSGALISSDITFDGKSALISSQQIVEDKNAQMTVLNTSITLGDFYQEGTNKIQLLKIENQGSGTGGITSISLPPGYGLVSNNCTNVRPGASCVIRLVYSSTDQDKGAHTDTVTVGDSDVDLTVNQVSKPNSLSSIKVVVDENIHLNNCVPVVVSVQDDQNLPFVSSGSLALNSSLNLFSDNACSSSASLSLSAFESEHQWFLKIGESGPKTLQLSSGSIQVVKELYIYSDLQLSLSNSHVVLGSTVNLSSVGGKPNLSYSILSGGGSLLGNIYTADSIGIKVLQVTDSLNNVSQAQVEIHPVLVATESAFEKITNQNYQSLISGGKSPFVYSVTGVGSIDGVGNFFSPVAGNVDIKVKDSLNQEVHILGVVYNPLQISVLNNNLVLGQPATVSVTGGKPSVSFSVVSGGGSFNGAIYAADSVGVKVLKATDALGQTAQVSIEVFSVIVANVTTFENIVNQNYTPSISGGKLPYSYTNTGVGTIGSSSGIFTSAVAGAVDIKVKDALNQEVHVTGNVYSVLDISPKNQSITLSNNQTFSGVGGKSPYTFNIVSGVGSVNLNTGLFSSNQAGTSQIRVTDALGQTAQTGITVNSNLTIGTGTCTSSIPESFSCTVTSSGGVGSRTYSTNQGTINPTTGLFVGSCVANLGSSIVTVTDQYNNSQQVTLNYPCIYKSCSQIRAHSYATTSGNFWIDPDGINTGTVQPEYLYCEFDTNGAWTLVSRLNTNDSTSQSFYETAFWEGSGYGTLTGSNDYMAQYYANNAGFKEIRLKYTYGVSSSDTTIESTYKQSDNVLSLKQNLVLSFSNSKAGWSRTFTGTGESANFFGNNLMFRTIGNGSLSNLSNGGADLSRIWYNVRPVDECNQGGSIGHIGDYNTNNWTWEVARGYSDSAGGCQHNVYRLGLGTNYDKKSWGGTNVNPTAMYTNGFMYLYTKDIYYYHPTSCLDAKNKGVLNQAGTTSSGTYTVDPDGYGFGQAPVSVYCDQVTDGGGWTLVSYAGTIPASGKKSGASGSTTAFVPLFHVFGNIDANAMTTKSSFSRFDIFKPLASGTSRFMAKRTSVPNNMISWSLVNVNLWGGTNSTLPAGTQTVLRMTNSGNDGWQNKTNAFFTTAGASDGGYPGISWNTALYANDDNVGSFTTFLSRRSILYFATEDYVSSYGAQWFHASPLSLSASTSPSNTVQDVEFYFRE